MRIRSIRTRVSAEDHDERSQPALIAVGASVLTEAEAALYIGMSRAWLKKSRTRRFRSFVDAPSFVRAGARRVVYRQRDLDAWLERHVQRVGTDEGATQVTSL